MGTVAAVFKEFGFSLTEIKNMKSNIRNINNNLKNAANNDPKKVKHLANGNEAQQWANKNTGEYAVVGLEANDSEAAKKITKGKGVHHIVIVVKYDNPDGKNNPWVGGGNVEAGMEIGKASHHFSGFQNNVDYYVIYNE